MQDPGTSQRCLNPLQVGGAQAIHYPPESWPAQVFQHVLKMDLAVITHDDNRNDSMLEGLCSKQLGKACREGKPRGKMGKQPAPGTASCAIGKIADITFS